MGGGVLWLLYYAVVETAVACFCFGATAHAGCNVFVAALFNSLFLQSHEMQYTLMYRSRRTLCARGMEHAVSRNSHMLFSEACHAVCFVGDVRRLDMYISYRVLSCIVRGRWPTSHLIGPPACMTVEPTAL